MADKKISALTAATTPLAGTEVLPIVQGGSTVKVSIADVTAGRAVTASGVVNSLGAVGTPSYTFSGDLNTGMWSPAADTVAVSVNGVESFRANTTGFGIGVSPAYRLDVLNAGDLSGRIRNNNTGTGLFAQLLFETNNGFSGTSQGYIKATSLNGGNADISLVIDQTGNITASTGNLVIGTAGKGIDFSAATHAAGMTSELLNDYEEGTYTVAIGCGTSGTVTLNTSFDTAQYTKVGRLVTVTGGVIVSSVLLPLGYFTISLPFTSASLSELLTISGVNTANIADFVSLGVNGASSIRVYLGDATALQGDSAQELKAGTEMYFTISYIAA
jgi:hypothetical protein